MNFIHSCRCVLVFAIGLFATVAYGPANAQSPVSSSTFHCISLNWTPAGSSAAKKVFVKYRKAGTQVWHKGHEMVYNRVYDTLTAPVGDLASSHDYRGSIVNLTPGTNYQVRLELEGTQQVALFNQTTVSETFLTNTSLYPTVNSTANSSTMLNITLGGGNGAYKIYDGKNFTINLNSNTANGLNAISVNADWVIIRNFNIINAPQHAVNIGSNRHHIVIENCSISQWGDPITIRDSIIINNVKRPDPRQGYAKSRAAIFNSTGGAQLTIQRNKIHEPKYNSTFWYEFQAYDLDQPAGTSGILINNTGDGCVLRYNEVYGTTGRYLNNGITGEGGNTYKGSPGTNNDLYGNYIAHCYDDGIESEGGQTNVRYWNNYIDDIYYPFGLAPVSVGPVYVWRNVLGRIGLYALKFGNYGGVKMQTGRIYIYNNTFLQQNQDGAAGFGITPSGGGTSGGKGRDVLHVTSRNNILRQRDGASKTFSVLDVNRDNSYDYDLISTGQSTAPDNGQTEAIETNGFRNSLPLYVASASTANDPLLNSNRTGNFRIKFQSPGRDGGQIISNFADAYTGNGPDVGANEGQTSDMVFGVNAAFVPPVPNGALLDDLEAENAAYSGFALHTTQSPGYEGTGYVKGTNASNDYVEWTVQSPYPATAVLKFRYANGDHCNVCKRPLKLYVNGALAGRQTLQFKNNSSWTTWQTEQDTVNLVAGTNTIKLQSFGVAGTNLDNLKYEILQTGNYEAEYAQLTGCSIETNHPPYQADGYVNFLATTTDTIEWTVAKSIASTAALRFRYANGSGTTRTVALNVNGVAVTNLSFPATGNPASWAAWTDLTVPAVNFIAGNNKIRLITIGASDGPNVDYMSFTSNPASVITPTEYLSRRAPAESSTESTAAQTGIHVFPNPSRGTVRLQVSATNAGTGDLQVVSSSGSLVKRIRQNFSGGSSLVQLTNLSPGVYTAQLTMDGKLYTTRFVVAE